MNIVVDPAAGEIRVDGTVVVPPPSVQSQTAPGVTLVLSKLMGDLQLQLSDGTGRPIPGTISQNVSTGADDSWSIRPTNPIGPPGLSVHFSYRGGHSTAAQFHIGVPASFASAWGTDWYPLVAGAQDKGTGVLRITSPAGTQIVATGERRAIGRMTTNVAAFDVRHPAYFSFAVAPYSIVRTATVRGVPVALYALSERPSAHRYVARIARTLEILEDEFGPYPFRELAIVEVPEREGNEARLSGASTEGMVIALTSFIDAPFNTAYFGHELAHQWFPLSAALTGPAGRYLADEALAQYGSERAVELLDGPDIAEEYRRSGYPGYFLDFSGEGYLRYLAQGLDQNPLGSLPPSFVSQRVAYSKGMFFWSGLSRVMGRQEFRRRLQRFWSVHRFGTFTSGELRTAFVGSRRDIATFWDQWSTRTGIPQWTLDWRANGRVASGRIVQQSPAYTLSVEVDLVGPRGERLTRNLRLNRTATAFRLRAPFQIREIAVDPRFRVLHWTEETRRRSFAWLPFMRLTESPPDAEFQAALDALHRPDAYGVRFMIEQRWGSHCLEQRRWACAVAHLTAAAGSTDRVAGILPYVYVNLVRAAQNTNDLTHLRQWALDALTADEAIGGHVGARAMVLDALDCEHSSRGPTFAAICLELSGSRP